MRIMIVALAALLAACQTTQPVQTEIRGDVIIIGPSAVAAQQCLGAVTREDVPYVEGGPRATDSQLNAYVRVLEDGIEICQNVVKETTRAAEEARAEAERLNNQ